MGSEMCIRDSTGTGRTGTGPNTRLPYYLNPYHFDPNYEDRFTLIRNSVPYISIQCGTGVPREQVSDAMRGAARHSRRQHDDDDDDDTRTVACS